jgi:hypothetical protein
LNPAERKLAIKALREQLDVLRIACEGYCREFDEETSNREQQSLLAHRWDVALKARRSLQFVLDCLELEAQKETPEDGAFCKGGK